MRYPPRRSEDDRGAALALGEERQSDDTEQHVQRDRREPAPGAEGAADDEDAEGLAGPRDGIARDGEAGRQVDDQGAGRRSAGCAGPGR